MARPPARLATISSSCCSWAKASNGNAHTTLHKRKSIIRHANEARRNRESLRLRPGMTCRDSEQNESFARSFTPHDPSGQLEATGPHYHTQEARMGLRNRQHV